MKSSKLSTQSLGSFRFYIAGLLLTIACILFIISHVHVRWSIFPVEYGNIDSMYVGLWHRHTMFNGRIISHKIKCTNGRLLCMKLFTARICMIMAFLTSTIGCICLCILPTSKNKVKLILYRTGLSLAFLSFFFGLIGFITGLCWAIQYDRDQIGSTAICALIGSLVSLASAICAFIINSKESQ